MATTRPSHPVGSPTRDADARARRLPGRLAPLGVAAAALALGWIALERWPHPFAWLGLIGFIACIAFVRLSSSARVRAIWLNLGFVFLVPGLYELWLGLDEDRRHRDLHWPDYIVRDDVFGYRVRESVAVPERFFMDGELVFDVVYTIGANGLRIPPPYAGGEGSLCVVFFGCSFTFGMGLPDDATSPWLTGALSGHRHRVHNVALNGWGPHQLLSGLESGRIDSLIDCTPTHVIYHSLHDHVQRVAGAPHDVHGPRYVLDATGAARREGRFDDSGPPFALRWPRLARSHVLRRRAESFEPGPQDFALFHAVVDASRREVERRWPGAEFHVLLWNKTWKYDAEYWEGLERRGIAVHPITGILPNYPEDRALYGIPNDGHPNRLANEHIARYVVREILHETPASTAPPSDGG